MTTEHETPMGISYCAIWGVPALDFGGVKLWVVIAANAGIVLQAAWVPPGDLDLLDTGFPCEAAPQPRIYSPQALCLCLIPAPQEPLSCALVSLWGRMHFKDICGRNIPAKQRDPTTQGRAEPLQERTRKGFQNMGLKMGWYDLNRV